MNPVHEERAAANEQIQRSLKAWRSASGGAGQASVPKGGGSPLSSSVRSRMEPRLGANLGNVRVHTSGESATAAKGFGARAFTVGEDVHFNSGEFNPGTKEGDKLLAHELTHVVQGQKSGIQRKAEGEEKKDAKGGGEAAGADAAGGDEKGAEVSDPNEPAEKEADAVGDQVGEDLHADGEKGDEKGGEKKKGAKGDKKGGEKKAAKGEEDKKEGVSEDGAKDVGGEKGDVKAEAAPIAAKLYGTGFKVFRANAQVAPPTDRPAQDPSVSEPSLNDPLKHPYFKTFEGRVKTLFASGQVAGGDATATAAAVWTKICQSAKAAAPDMNNPAAYSNFVKKWVDMTSPVFERAMGQYQAVAGELVKISQAQFVKANSFGFWSKDDGRKLAESCSELTLETSGVGNLMDNMPSISSGGGWDPDLFGALSKAYADAVVKEVQGKDKKINVCLGWDAPDTGNIWATIESKAVEKGLGDLAKIPEDKLAYLGAACKTKSNRKELDLTKNGGGVPGSVYKGKSRADAKAAAKAHFDSAPA